MEPPVPPDESDCCNSGCNPCILDVYDAQLRKYKDYFQNSQFQDISSKKVNAITQTSYTKFKLIERKQISETAFLFKFAYDDNRDIVPNCFHYNPGQYIMLKGKDYEGEFTRAYTPIPSDGDDDLGFTIIARLYDFGRMSKLLKNIRIGCKTKWRGPYGDFSINYNYKHVLFVAQGTAIAPIYAVIHKIINNEECESFVKLFFCCRSCDDILLRQQIYGLSSFWNFSYEVFLSDKTNVKRHYNETIHETKMDCSHLSDYIQGKFGLVQVIICGSESFSTNVREQLVDLGLESNEIYSF